MKAVVAAFNQEKALVGAFSVITNLRMKLFQALLATLSIASGEMSRLWRWKLLKFPDEIRLLERRVLNIKMVTRLKLSAWNFVHWCPVLCGHRLGHSWNGTRYIWEWTGSIWFTPHPHLWSSFFHHNQFSLLNPGVWSHHPIVAFYLTVVIHTV